MTFPVFDVLFSSLCLVNEQGGGALGVVAMHCGNSSAVVGEGGCRVSIQFSNGNFWGLKRIHHSYYWKQLIQSLLRNRQTTVEWLYDTEDYWINGCWKSSFAIPGINYIVKYIKGTFIRQQCTKNRNVFYLRFWSFMYRKQYCPTNSHSHGIVKTNKNTKNWGRSKMHTLKCIYI